MSKHVLYVAAHVSRQIVCFEVDDASGAMRCSRIQEMPPSTGPSPFSLPMALSPDHDLLYAALRTPPFLIATFKIDRRNGDLRQVGLAELDDGVCYMTVDPKGPWLLSASHKGGKLLCNRIGEEGFITSETSQVIRDLRAPHSIIFDPADNDRIYAAVCGENRILALRLDRASGLMQQDIPALTVALPDAGPRHLVTHPALDRLYCVNESGGTIDVYRIQRPRGELVLMQSISMMPRHEPPSPKERTADIHLTPDGRFLYASERRFNTLAGFTVDPVTGELAYIDSWPTEQSPRGFAIHPLGSFLYCAGQLSGHIASYCIDAASGELSPLQRHPAGEGPNWIEMVALQ